MRLECHAAMTQPSGNSGLLNRQLGFDPVPERRGPSSQEFGIAMLLVCEDGRVLDTLNRALDRFSVKTTLARTLAEARTHLQSRKFDSIVVDFQNAEVATGVLRAMRESKMNTASIIMAIADKSAESQEAFKCGATFTIPRLQTVDQAIRCLRSAYSLVLRNKRTSIRFPLDQEISIFRENEPPLEGRITNLSETGMKLTCQVALHKGSMLNVVFKLPNAAQIKTAMLVVWVRDNGETGGQFVKLDAISLKGIQEWINSKLLGRLS